jgi:hypothetical protein
LEQETAVTQSIAQPAQCTHCEAGDPTAPAIPPAASLVYAVGKIEARFPSLSVEKEFAQVAGRSDTAGKTDQQLLHTVLSHPDNRYLARQACWVLTVQGLETYLLRPRDPADLDRLLGAIRPQPNPLDLDVVIGARGPIAPPDYCNGLMVPIVIVEQIYSFDQDTLLKAVPRPDGLDAKKFRAASEEVFARILQMTDNAGCTPEHRALNYLAMRYPGIYARAAESFARDFSLTAVETRPSNIGTLREIVEVFFVFTNRNTDFIEKYMVRVDVTEGFPFLVTKLAPCYDR